MVRIAGPPDEVDRTDAVVRELLGRAGVAPDVAHVDAIDPREVVTPVATPDPPIGRAWIDLGQADRATLYVADRTWERVLLRVVPREGGADEVAREEIAHILEATVEALVAGDTIGRPREEVRAELRIEPPAPPPPAPAPSPAPRAPGPAPSRARFFGGPRAEAQVFSAEEPLAFGVGALAGVARETSRYVLVALWRVPVSHTSGDVGVRLDGGAVRAEGAIRVWAGRFDVWLAAGGGADLVHVTPTKPAGSTVSLFRARWVALPVGRAALSLSAGPVDVGLAADVDLSATRYFVDRHGARETVLDPFPVRPTLTVSAVFE